MTQETGTSTGRTGWDLVLGALVVLVGIVILGHAAIATVLSVVFLGWLLLVSGIMAVFVCLFQIGKPGFWTGMLAGVTMAVLGLVLLRHPEAAAVTLTLVAGALFLAVGIAQLAVAAEIPEQRAAMILGGGVSVLLGLLVLFNIFSASLTLLGVILGVQVLSEGVAIMIVGRGALRAGRAPADPSISTGGATA